jgi:integrase/recombinase XerC/integrase/recombinase XerD
MNTSDGRGGMEFVLVVRELLRGCIWSKEGEIRILVHGKGRDGYVYPREDTVKALMEYLAGRKAQEAGKNSMPEDSGNQVLHIFAAVGNRAGGKRITRDGVRCVVNFYLNKAGLKRPGVSCHALRHTCGALLYQATRDIKVVQETLRHADISMAAKYSHVIERRKTRYTREIPVKV